MIDSKDGIAERVKMDNCIASGSMGYFCCQGSYSPWKHCPENPGQNVTPRDEMIERFLCGENKCAYLC